MCIVSTFSLKRKNEQNIKLKRQGSLPNIKQNYSEYTLEKLCSNGQAIHKLMTHLSKEFSFIYKIYVIFISYRDCTYHILRFLIS